MLHWRVAMHVCLAARCKLPTTFLQVLVKELHRHPVLCLQSAQEMCSARSQEFIRPTKNTEKRKQHSTLTPGAPHAPLSPQAT